MVVVKVTGSVQIRIVGIQTLHGDSSATDVMKLNQVVHTVVGIAEEVEVVAAAEVEEVVNLCN